MAKKGSILLNLAGLTPAKTKKIVDNLPDVDEVFKIKQFRRGQFPFLSSADIEKILTLRNSNLFSHELRLIEESKVEVIDIFDASYPHLLKEIPSPPLLLYAKGNIQLLSAQSIAVVGTRLPSQYGKTMAFDFSRELSLAGLAIVSGLARGIDTYAHKGALETGGLTVAVLGSGLNHVYPHQNRELASEIFKKGLLVSEYPLNTMPLPENFPRRNRIISGLSKGVVVVEAASRSGALITANFAVNQNREVFAVPGPVGRGQNKGTHSLIKEGAMLVDSVEDILEEINILQGYTQ